MAKDDKPLAASGAPDPVSAWELPDGENAPAPEQALRVDVDGFEGPLDLLLALARTQKVDLSRISVVALAGSSVASTALTFVNPSSLSNCSAAAIAAASPH